jgi:holo-[acyl-carrier protein] synthase
MPGNVGIGCDVEEITRFHVLGIAGDHPFYRRVYTGEEMEQCLGTASPFSHLAARFSGKEAVIKALSGLGIGGIRHLDVEILRGHDGEPRVSLRREGLPPLCISLSLSHSRSTCMAVALAREV